MTGAREKTAPVTGLIPLLNIARRKARLLPPKHPTVAGAIRALLDGLGEGLELQPSLTVSLLGGEIYLNGHLLAQESISHVDMVRDFEARRLTSIMFSGGLSFDELARFVVLTNMRPEEVAGRGGWQAIFGQENIQHVGTGLEAGPDSGGEKQGDGDPAAREAHQLCLNAVITFFSDVREGQTFDYHTFQHCVKMFTAVLMDDQQVFHNLSVMKDKNLYTFYHSVNVAILSLLIGFKLNLDPPVLEAVGAAAMLHDVGKMRIPPEILDKPGELSKDELAVMQTHSIEGARILMQMPETQGLPMVVAAQHHARHSLGGYPSFSGIGRLHLLTEIVAVADVYDALTSNRSYRAAMQPDQAMRIIAEGSGKHFHPTVVNLFAQLSGLYPIGTLVELDTGELAVVVRPNAKDLYRPDVRIISSRPGSHAYGMEVRLSEKNAGAGYDRSIVQAVDPAEYGLDTSFLLMGAFPNGQ